MFCDNCLLSGIYPRVKSEANETVGAPDTLHPSPAPLPTSPLLLFLSPFAELYIAKETNTHIDCDLLRKIQWQLPYILPHSHHRRPWWGWWRWGPRLHGLCPYIFYTGWIGPPNTRETVLGQGILSILYIVCMLIYFSRKKEVYI